MTGGEPDTLRRWLAVPAALLLILLVAFAVLLGQEMWRQVDGLSTAESDNVQWNLSQGEVEHLRLEAAVQGGNLADLRRSFDVLYSRTATYSESPLFGGLRRDPVAGPLLRTVRSRLDGLIPLIDGPDAALRDALPDLRAEMAVQRAEIRKMSLAGIALHARESEARRVALSGILARLGWVVVFLVAALAGGGLVLWLLYRRGRRFAADSAKSAGKMEAMVSSSLDAILMVDTEGRIRGFNGAAEAIFGFTQEEALGALMADLIIPPEYREAHRAGMKRFAETGVPKVVGKGRIELEALHKSGRVFPVELSIMPSTSGGETVFVSFLRDITEPRAAEAELRRARDDALAGERAKANLLTVMSHEMRTPLNGVLGAISLLRETGVETGQQRYLDAIRVSGDLLLRHVNDVLELSRLEAGAAAGAAEVFDLCALVSGLAESQQPNASSRGNRLEVDCALDGQDHALGDPLQVQRILLNLLGNALKFTRDGVISVNVSRLGGGMVEFTVADTGIGIETADVERIFDDFITLDASYARQSEGTGLGLAISRRLVEAMGGEIGAESEPGEGSLFWFTLPLPVAAQAEDAGGSDMPGAAPARKILIVEDNDINRLLLETMLDKQGHTVVSASGGAEGVERAAAERFDLILMDISMPQVDGIEALAQIRGRGLAPGTPAVALTAHAAAEDHARIRAAGFAEVLTKPISQAGLAGVIRRQGGGGIPAAAPQEAGGLAGVIGGLGAEKAQAYLAAFEQELKALRAALAAGEAPAPELKQEAHRLAGSAAVLGFDGLYTCLAALEAEDGPWDPSALDAAWARAEAAIRAARAA